MRVQMLRMVGMNDIEDPDEGDILGNHSKEAEAEHHDHD